MGAAAVEAMGVERGSAKGKRQKQNEGREKERARD